MVPAARRKGASGRRRTRRPQHPYHVPVIAAAPTRIVLLRASCPPSIPGAAPGRRFRLRELAHLLQPNDPAQRRTRRDDTSAVGLPGRAEATHEVPRFAGGKRRPGDVDREQGRSGSPAQGHARRAAHIASPVNVNSRWSRPSRGTTTSAVSVGEGPTGEAGSMERPARTMLDHEAEIRAALLQLNSDLNALLEHLRKTGSIEQSSKRRNVISRQTLMPSKCSPKAAIPLWARRSPTGSVIGKSSGLPSPLWGVPRHARLHPADGRARPAVSHGDNR